MSRKGDRKREKRLKWQARYAAFIAEMQRREGVDLVDTYRSKRWWKSAYSFYRHKWTIEDRTKVSEQSQALDFIMDTRLGGT